jgi:hypothetical protein
VTGDKHECMEIGDLLKMARLTGGAGTLLCLHALN